MAEDTAEAKINVRAMLNKFQIDDKANAALKTLKPQQHLQYVVATHKKSQTFSRSQSTNYEGRQRGSSGGSDIVNDINQVKSRLRRRRSSELKAATKEGAELKQEFVAACDRRSLISHASLAAKALHFQRTRGSRIQRRRLNSGAPYLGLGRISLSSGDELDCGDDADDEPLPDNFEVWDDIEDDDEVHDNVTTNSIPKGLIRDATNNNGSSNHSNNIPIIPAVKQPVEEPIEAQESFSTQSAFLESSMLDSDEGSSLASRIAKFTAPTLPRHNVGIQMDTKEDPEEEESPYSDLHIVPLRENKLLKNELFRDRRRSRSVGDLTMLKLDNITGLFQKARATNTKSIGLDARHTDSDDAWNDSANKPPIATKPQIPKKPQNVTVTTSINNKPSNTKPLVVNKPTTPVTTLKSPSLHGSAPNIATKPSHWESNQNGNPPHIAKLQSHENENDPLHIYDEVYSQPTQKKDLTRLFGATPTPATDPVPSQSRGYFALRKDVDPSQSFPPPFAEKPKKDKNRKHSRHRTEPQMKDDTTPYAVSQPLHADKIFHRKKKTSQTSADRSGDSGVAGLQMLPVPQSTRARFGAAGSTKSEDSDFGSTTSDQEDSGSEEGYIYDEDDSWDSTTDSQAPEPINFVDESHKVAYEVLTSERTYVERLSLLDQVFLARIERENEKSHWFSVEVIKEIFSNMRSIYAFHCNFLLPELESRLKTWEQNPSIGDILKRLAPFLKLYSDYVSNFDNSMKLLNSWSQKAPKFGSLLNEIQRQPQCMNLALQHHMLEPVQRIPRYELLLKDYLKRLPSDSADRMNAEEALERIAKAAHHSNDQMKKTDQFQKLLKLNDKIEGEDIIDPSRQLLKEGKIVKIAARGGNTHKEMYLFLFNDMMLCCVRGKILKRVTYNVRHKLDVDGMKILDAEDCRFRVESKQKALELQTTSEEEKEDWMKSIISAVHEMVRKKQTFINNDAINDRPSSRELHDECELGMRAPRWIKDEEVTMCMRCGTDFKAITRRRHHCRACGAVVCNKCSGYEAQLPYDDNKVNRVCYKCYYTFKGEEEGAKEQMRRSLITEIDEENSYSGFLSVLQKREWVRFWVVATKQDLFALKAPKDVRPVLTLPIKLYKVCEISDSDNVDRLFAFKLSDGSRSQHIFAADSKELMKRWLMVFNEGVESVLKTKFMTDNDEVARKDSTPSVSSSSSGASLMSFSSSHKSYTLNAT